MGILGSKDRQVSEWEYLGLLSFDRFYNLIIEETITMVNNPNEAL